jgi:Protein of unknown function (DUF3054)
MASTDRPELAPATSRVRRGALLVAGDMLAFHAVTAIGLLSHGELTGLDGLPHLAEVAMPFAAGWFLAAPFVGAFRSDVIALPRRMLVRTIVAWLIACPIGLLFWSLVRQRSIQPAFAVVTFLTNLVVLLGWRGMFAFLAGREGFAE